MKSTRSVVRRVFSKAANSASIWATCAARARRRGLEAWCSSFIRANCASLSCSSPFIHASWPSIDVGVDRLVHAEIDEMRRDADGDAQQEDEAAALHGSLAGRVGPQQGVDELQVAARELGAVLALQPVHAHLGQEQPEERAAGDEQDGERADGTATRRARSRIRRSRGWRRSIRAMRRQTSGARFGAGSAGSVQRSSSGSSGSGGEGMGSWDGLMANGITPPATGALQESAAGQTGADGPSVRLLVVEDPHVQRLARAEAPSRA